MCTRFYSLVLALGIAGCAYLPWNVRHVPDYSYATALFRAQQQAGRQNTQPMAQEVLFAEGSAVLSADAQRILTRQSTWLKQNPSATFDLQGHSNMRLGRAHALALAYQRARAVRRFFVSQGIADTRLRLLVHDKLQPVFFCVQKACWAKNRRVVSSIRWNNTPKNF